MDLRESLATVLAVLLLSVPQVAQTQELPTASQARPEEAVRTPRGLQIVILQGHDAVNSLRSRSAADPAVQVLDYLGEPIEGAEVTFEVPSAGPGGVFENGRPLFTTRTDSRGQATAAFTPNTLAGSFAIRVVARANDQKGEVLIRQSNSASLEAVEYRPPRSRPWHRDWRWWTMIGVGAGVGGYFAHRAISSSPSTNPVITLTPGVITIGGTR
jgi:hypothetical protein